MADDKLVQSEAEKELNLDPEKNQGDLMLPLPSPEQDILWNRLDEVVGEKELTREIAWVRTPADIQEYLASEDVAKRIRRIGEKHKLSGTQVQELARLIRYVFIKEIDFKNVIVAVFENLKTDRETAKNIGEDIKLELFVPKRDYLLTLHKEEKGVAPHVPASPPKVPTPPVPIPPRERSANLVLGEQKGASVPSPAPRPSQIDGARNPSVSTTPPLLSVSPDRKSWEDRFASVAHPVDPASQSSGIQPKTFGQDVSKPVGSTPGVRPSPALGGMEVLSGVRALRSFLRPSDLSAEALAQGEALREGGSEVVRSVAPPSASREALVKVDSLHKQEVRPIRERVIPQPPVRPPAASAPLPKLTAPEPQKFRVESQYGIANTLKSLRDAENIPAASSSSNNRPDIPPATSQPSKTVSSPPVSSQRVEGGVQLDDLYKKAKFQEASSGASVVSSTQSVPTPHGSPKPDMKNFMRTMSGDLAESQEHKNMKSPEHENMKALKQ